MARPNAQKLLSRKSENYNVTGVSCKEFVLRDNSDQGIICKSARKDKGTDLESKEALPSEWQHGGQQPSTSFAKPCAS
jgi:hypothetical protein